MIRALDGGLRGDPRRAPCMSISAAAIQKSSSNGSASTNVSCQLPRESQLFLTARLSRSPVSWNESASTSLGGVPRLSDRDGVRWNALKHQSRWPPHALSNSIDATPNVSCGQVIASSNGFTGAIDPSIPFTTIHWGEHSIPQ
jgi:hypothetical protein